jgi:hypothetical protein
MRKRQGKERKITWVRGGNSIEPEDFLVAAKNWEPFYAASSIFKARSRLVCLLQHSHILFVRAYLDKKLSELLNALHRFAFCTRGCI